MGLKWPFLLGTHAVGSLDLSLGAAVAAGGVVVPVAVVVVPISADKGALMMIAATIFFISF